ncbi:hypothetical protein FSARC_4767 [Fusarium sarcochroum]|uniref:Uncharacterized protein n=1 Tax=Fusarium sarcochroum TaxID=1208366 RepID=A0A8H4U0Y7_9HYPO|nr:hypothetical protein FSARC_4767 [Fusarium sarcochroum]
MSVSVQTTVPEGQAPIQVTPNTQPLPRQETSASEKHSLSMRGGKVKKSDRWVSKVFCALCCCNWHYHGADDD